MFAEKPTRFGPGVFELVAEDIALNEVRVARDGKEVVYIENEPTMLQGPEAMRTILNCFREHV